MSGLGRNSRFDPANGYADPILPPFGYEYILGTGDIQLSKGFLEWRAWVRKNPDMSAGRLLELTCPHLSEAECAAYEAPFPDIRYKAGVRRFPEIVPDRPHAPGA